MTRRLLRFVGQMGQSRLTPTQLGTGKAAFSSHIHLSDRGCGHSMSPRRELSSPAFVLNISSILRSRSSAVFRWDWALGLHVGLSLVSETKASRDKSFVLVFVCSERFIFHDSTCEEHVLPGALPAPAPLISGTTTSPTTSAPTWAASRL